MHSIENPSTFGTDIGRASYTVKRFWNIADPHSFAENPDDAWTLIKAEQDIQLQRKLVRLALEKKAYPSTEFLCECASSLPDFEIKRRIYKHVGYNVISSSPRLLWQLVGAEAGSIYGAEFLSLARRIDLPARDPQGVWKCFANLSNSDWVHDIIEFFGGDRLAIQICELWEFICQQSLSSIRLKLVEWALSNQVIPNDNQILFQALVTETNLTLRNRITEHLDNSFLLGQLGATLVDYNGEYELYRTQRTRLSQMIKGNHWIPNPILEPFCILKCTCPSTGNIYHLRVPPEIGSARQAVAWTFGEAVKSYKPEIET